MTGGGWNKVRELTLEIVKCCAPSEICSGELCTEVIRQMAKWTESTVMMDDVFIEVEYLADRGELDLWQDADGMFWISDAVWGQSRLPDNHVWTDPHAVVPAGKPVVPDRVWAGELADA